MNRTLGKLLEAAVRTTGDFHVTHEEADTLRAWEKAPRYFDIWPDGKERFWGMLLVEGEEGQ